MLQNAINNIDFGSQQIPLEILKRNISFQAVVPDSVAKSLEDLKEIKDDKVKMEQLEKINGHSNVFVVKLNLASDLGLDQEQGRILLDNIILAYKQQLIDKYGDNAVLADVFASDLDLDQYDYIQAASILDDQLERMELYVSSRMPQTNTDSTVTGLNPADIASALQSIRTVDMERIYTAIGALYLTKEPDKIVARYEQLAEDNEKEAAQCAEEGAAIRSAIATYKKDEQTVVLGSVDAQPVNLKSENQEYNRLVTKYVEAGTQAANAREDAKYYRSEAERFRSAQTLGPINSTVAKQTEDGMKLLKEKLIYWTEIINTTAKDYYSQTTYQHYAEQLMPARTYDSLEEGLSMALIAAVGLVLGLVLGVLAVLFRAYMKEETFGQAGKEAAAHAIAFEGAGKSLDPQGNRFDVNGLKHDEVLAKALQESGLEKSMTVEELKRRIYILPLAERDTMKELLTLTTIEGKTEDIKERMVYPTSFIVGLKDMGVPSPFENNKLMQNILTAYQERLKSRYLFDTLSEPAYTREEILDMDYPEMMRVLDQEAGSLLRYVKSYAGNDPLFVSKKTGLSFADLYAQAELLKNTDIGSMRSLVNFYLLTKDAPSRLLYEDAMLRRAAVVANKLAGAQYTTSDILLIYDNSSNYVFTSGDAGTVNLAPMENQFYGALVDALVGKQQSYINAKYDEQDILRAIGKLQTSNLAGAAYQSMTGDIRTGAAITILYLICGILYRELKQTGCGKYLEIIAQALRRKRHDNRQEKSI